LSEGDIIKLQEQGPWQTAGLLGETRSFAVVSDGCMNTGEFSVAKRGDSIQERQNKLN
jgi:hypothetical protein